MTILIAGASGILGRDMCSYLDKENIKYIGTYNTRPIPNGIQIDFLNESILTEQLSNCKASVVINCIVERFTDVCEKNWNKTVKANINIPDILSRVCNKLNIYLIHISTDYVFDGRKPPYFPESSYNPLQNYGISKLIAEKRVIENSNNILIIRVPVLYTDSYTYLDETAVTTLGKKAMNLTENFVEDNVSIRRPVFIPDFCKFIFSAITNRYLGIYHFYNPRDRTTKYELTTKIASYLNLPYSHIKPINSFEEGAANRPIDTELVDKKYQIQDYFETDIESGFKKCFEKFWHPRFQECPQDFLVLFDMDGTIVDTEVNHYNAYKKALEPWTDLSEKDFTLAINDGDIKKIFADLNIPKDEWETIRAIKKKYLCEIENNIKFIKGAEEFIKMLSDLGITMAVVTNTCKEFVENVRSISDVCKLIPTWISREDYVSPKPNNECYKKAVEICGNKKYIIGFENSYNGLKALEGVTTKRYCITNKNYHAYHLLKSEDSIFINDFTHFLDEKQ